jgi:hypothetical protein
MKAKSMLIVPAAFIGTNKNRLKIYDDQFVFLENGQEFQFEIKNPTKEVIGVNIWINGVISSSSKLVLKPGESTWLDRYLDDAKKYVFETYEVEGSNENKKAIEDNGKIRFEFFKEQAKRDLLFGNTGTVTYTDYPTTFTNTGGIHWTDNTSTLDISNINYYNSDIPTMDSSILRDSVQCSANAQPPKVETGRIGEGDNSNQSFQNVYYNFEYTAFETVEYQILPVSQKNVVTADEVRKYCTGCGVRIKRSSWKFCPTCGERL